MAIMAQSFADMLQLSRSGLNSRMEYAIRLPKALGGV